MATPTTERLEPWPGSSARNLGLWRAALVSVFFCAGIAVSTWVTRTPDIRDALHASTSVMGLVIGGSSVGSIIGISVGSPLAARRGARFVILAGMTSVAVGLGIMALGVVVTHSVVVAVGLALFGYGMGSGEIGNNVSGVELEASMGRSVIPGLHGSYSVGTVVGALLGLAANRVHLPVPVHLLLAASFIALTVALWVRRHVHRETGRRPRDESLAPGRRAPPACRPRLPSAGSPGWTGGCWASR